MNSVNLIGRLTADPEIRDVERKGKDDLTIASFSVAVDRVGSEEADFIRCKAFEATAEFAEKYLVKGQRVGISGRLQTGKYDDKEGITRYTTDVIVERITFADGKKGAADEDEDRRGKSRKRK